MEIFKRFLRVYYTQVGGPYAEEAIKRLQGEDWLRSLQLTPAAHPRRFSNAYDYRRASLATNLLRKLEVGHGDTYQEAVRRFKESEARNFKTNNRLRHLRAALTSKALFNDDLEFTWGRVVVAWRRRLTEVLGPIPERIAPRFSGGSTVEFRGKLKTLADKLRGPLGMYTGPVTHLLYNNAFEGTLLAAVPWVPTQSSVFFTVPKDSQTDRGCCMEATGSLALQLGVGAYLKQRYRTVYKVDLSEIPEMHKELARESSLFGWNATIDLSSASDSITRELVRLVLPTDWFELLNSLRAPSTLLDGEEHFFQLFSSMGNGFTFELETLLFHTLAETLCGEASVFGDDIIVARDGAEILIEALRFFGFETNEKKTFLEGPFRESCGGDFFNGESVRPIFIREIPEAPQHWMRIANKLKQIGLEYTKAWRFCVNAVPSHLRLFGPDWLGDLVFNSSSAEPTVRSGKPYYRIYRPVFPTISLDKYFPDDVRLAVRLLGGTRRLPIPGAGPTGFKTQWILAYGLGGVPFSGSRAPFWDLIGE